MGVDLNLLPLLGRDFWCSHEILSVTRRSDLWDKIETLNQMEIPKPLSCHFATIGAGTDDETQGYGDVENDPYENRLRWTTPKELLTLTDDPDIQDDWKNRAVWAYLSHLPENWPIVLYWY